MFFGKSENLNLKKRVDTLYEQKTQKTKEYNDTTLHTSPSVKRDLSSDTHN